MKKILFIATVILGLNLPQSAKADGYCGILYTLEKFKSQMEYLNPGLEFHAVWSFDRPKQAGYYYLNNATINPNRLATVVLIERGCVMLEIVAYKDVNPVIPTAGHALY